jgi:hypothetical protein
MWKKKEVKNNQITKQEKEKSKNDASLDRSGSFALDAPSCAFGDASPMSKNPARDISKRSKPDRDQDHR